MRIFIVIAALLACQAHAADKLPAYKADIAETSVSGLSSGAFMAVQYQVAHSSTVRGAGIVAGGPYYCAANNMLFAGICMGQVPFTPPNPTLMFAAAREFEATQQIDPLNNLEKSRIYIFSGTQDAIVRQPAVDSAVAFFKLAGVPEKHLRYVNNIPAGHAIITPAAGNNCNANAAPFISHCTTKGKGYDQAGDLLKHIYGPSLNPPAKTLRGKIIAFDQTEFVDSAASGMADTGYAYVPKSCADGATCKVHVALHGCGQSVEAVSSTFYTNAGYNRWADSNGIIVLYPQVNKSAVPFNPQGCWDWFGYSGPAYALKSGVQIRAIKAMVDRVSGGGSL